MLDDKKINEAANELCDYGSILSSGFRIDGFKKGVHWAISKFLKELWHPTEEIPEIGKVIIMENYYPDGRIMFLSNERKATSHNPIYPETHKWFYMEDLIPKTQKGNKL